MYDRRVSVSVFSSVAYVTWMATAALITAGITAHVESLVFVGLATSALAATLSMRCFCVKLNAGLQSAFDMGRDVGRSEADVRPLR